MPPLSKPAASAGSTAPASDMSLDEKVNHIFNMVNKIDATLNEQHVRIVKVETEVKELGLCSLLLRTLSMPMSRSSVVLLSGLRGSPSQRRRNLTDLLLTSNRGFLTESSALSSLWLVSRASCPRCLLWETRLSPVTGLVRPQLRPIQALHHLSLSSCAALRQG